MSYIQPTVNAVQTQQAANLFDTPANSVPQHMGQSMTILSVMLIPERGRSKQIIRPFNMVADYSSVSQLADRFANSSTLTIPSVAGTLGAGIRPDMDSLTPAPIHNGWGTSRYRWSIQVKVTPHLGAEQILMIDGWTDYIDNTMSGIIDPNMRFYINSTSSVNLVQQAIAPLHCVTDSSLIFRMPERSDANAMVYLQRPSDIHSVSETAALLNAAGGVAGNFGVLGGGVGLNNTPLSMLSRVADADIRSHSSSSRFIYDMVIAANTANTAGELDESYAQRSMRTRLQPKSQYRNPFISAVNRRMGHADNADYASFTYADLLQLDPGLSGSNRLVVEQEYSVVDYDNATDNSAAAQIATIYANAVPAYMAMHAIQTLEFTQMTDGSVYISKVVSVLQYADMSLLTQSLKAALQNELFVGASYDGQVPFSVNVKSRTFGYTEVSVLGPDGRQQNYIYPTYASSTGAPQLTDRVDTVMSLGSAVGDLMAEIASASKGVSLY